MEIMTTWNTDFEFDLQRFAAHADISTFNAGDDLKGAADALTAVGDYATFGADGAGQDASGAGLTKLTRTDTGYTLFISSESASTTAVTWNLANIENLTITSDSTYTSTKEPTIKLGNKADQVLAATLAAGAKITKSDSTAIATVGTGTATFTAASDAATLTSGTWSSIAAGTTIATKSSVSSTTADNVFTVAAIDTTKNATMTCTTLAVASTTDGAYGNISNATITAGAVTGKAIKFTAATVGGKAAIVESATNSAVGLTIDSDGKVSLTSGKFTLTNADLGNGITVKTGATWENVTVTADAVVGKKTVDGDSLTLASGTAAMATGSKVVEMVAGGKTYITGNTTVATFNGETGAITNFTAGNIIGETGEGITLNGVEYKDTNAANAVTVTANSTTCGASAATGGLDGVAGKTYQLMNTTGATGDLVAVGTVSNGITINITAGKAGVASTTLDDTNESFTITGPTGNYRTYTLIDTNVMEVNDNGTKSYKNVKAGNYEIDTVLTDYTGAGLVTTATVYNTAGTYNVNAVGIATKASAADKNAAATVVVGTNSKTVTVRSSIANGVTTTGDSDTVSITDENSGNSYTVAVNSNFTLANGGSFKATSGVISDATAATTFNLAGTADKIVAKGAVNVNIGTSTATDAVTFQAGTSVSGAKISTGATTYFTLSETGNNGSSAVDTVYNATTSAFTGLDGDVEVTSEGIASGAFTTTGSGTFTYNKQAYTVADDTNGVTFTMGATDTITEISDLVKDASVTISGKFSGTLTVGSQAAGGGNEAFSAISASNGVKFTSTDATGNATITLYNKGDKATYNGAIYEITAIGSSNDGIVVGQTSTVTNFIDALNDGDVLKVSTPSTGAVTAYVTYEVSGNVLTAKRYNASDVVQETKTYTLSDGETAFSVAENATTATSTGWTVSGGDAGETVGGTGLTIGVTNSTATTTSISNGIYVNNAGEITSSENKAVGQVSISDSTVTYQALTDKAQTVGVTGDSSGREDWVINTRGGKDTIAYAGTSTDASISSGAGNDAITATTTSRAQDIFVDAGEGKDRVVLTNAGNATVNAGSGNDVIIATGTGEVLINAESGNNEITHTGTNGNATIVGGSGNDTITAAGSDDVVSGGDGKDVFDITGSSVKISDYSFGNDVIQVAAGVTPSIGMLTGDGKVSVAAGRVADISASAGDFYAADIKIGTDKAGHYAWAKEGGSNIDVSTYSENVVLQGDADGTNTLYTGAGNDTIVSLADNDSVFGGAGKDTISLTTGAEKRTVGISTTSGKDTVSGFKAGFTDADSLFMADGAASDVKASYDSAKKQVMFKDGAGSLQMDSISAATSGAVELNVSGAKLAVLATGTKAVVDSATYADIFYGDGSAVDFSAVDGELNVNLANDLASTGDGAKYVGITSVIGGAGANTLMGSAKADSIVAGTGKSSLYGGAGSDTLVGNGEADVFFIADGTNTNTVVGFQTADKETYDTVKILGNIAGAKLNGSNVELSTADGSKAVVTGMNNNSMIRIESDSFTGVAKLGDSSKDNSFAYDKSVGFYGGGSKTDKISVASGFSDNAEVWLDGSKGTAYASVDVVDFANGAGNYVLAGDSSKNTIVGGKSDNALWGGAGTSADSLKGGTGKNNFYYGLAEGNDSISSSSADDTVNLYNISLSDITGGEITNTGVWLSFTDGSKLTVATNKDIKFTMSDGSTYTAEHSSKSWK